MVRSFSTFLCSIFISVYPLTLLLHAQTLITSVNIIKLNGQIQPLSYHEGHLDLSNVPDGLYMLLLQFDDGRLGMKKMVKNSGR